MIAFCAAKNKKDIVKIEYKGERRNSGLDNYVAKHKQMRNICASLTGYNIHGWNEFQKVTYLLGGIKVNSIDTCANVIMANPRLRNSFDRDVRHIQDFFT